jgi:hypothetical protein
MKCLEKTGDRRYRSMGDLTEELHRFIDGAEVRAQRDFSPSGEGVAAATDSDESAKTFVSMRTTESAISTTKSWWQFWR